MIYSDPGPVPPLPPQRQEEMRELGRLVHEAQVHGQQITADLLMRARNRFYGDPAFHARAVMAAQVAMVEYYSNNTEEAPVGSLRLAAAVALLLAEGGDQPAP